MQACHFGISFLKAYTSLRYLLATYLLGHSCDFDRVPAFLHHTLGSVFCPNLYFYMTHLFSGIIMPRNYQSPLHRARPVNVTMKIRAKYQIKYLPVKRGHQTEKSKLPSTVTLEKSQNHRTQENRLGYHLYSHMIKHSKLHHVTIIFLPHSQLHRLLSF